MKSPTIPLPTEALNEIKTLALTFLEGATTLDEFATQTLTYLIEHNIVVGREDRTCYHEAT